MNSRNIAIRSSVAAMFMLMSVACGSKSIKDNHEKKIVLDNTLGGEALPPWTRDGKVGWVEGKEHFLKAQYSIRGDQRVNACYDLAKMELKENLITEISSDIKGEINLAVEGISEASGAVLTKSFLQSMDANVRGLTIKEQLFERYVLSDAERVDCFVMGMITQSEYQNLKNNILQKMEQSSPAIAEALKKRQVKFFEAGQAQPNSVDQ